MFHITQAMEDSQGADLQKQREAAAISESVSEILRNPQLGALEILDDPTALIEAALAPETSLLPGDSGKPTIVPSSVVPPQGTSAPSLQPSIAPTSAIASQTTVGPSTVPQSLPSSSSSSVQPVTSTPLALNPPLAVPDISQYASLTAAAATSGSRGDAQLGAQVGGVPSALNPPLKIPDISQFVSLPQLVSASATKPAVYQHTGGNVTMPSGTHAPVDLPVVCSSRASVRRKSSSSVKDSIRLQSVSASAVQSAALTPQEKGKGTVEAATVAAAPVGSSSVAQPSPTHSSTAELNAAIQAKTAPAKKAPLPVSVASPSSAVSVVPPVPQSTASSAALPPQTLSMGSAVPTTVEQAVTSSASKLPKATVENLNNPQLKKTLDAARIQTALATALTALAPSLVPTPVVQSQHSSLPTSLPTVVPSTLSQAALTLSNLDKMATQLQTTTQAGATAVKPLGTSNESVSTSQAPPTTAVATTPAKGTNQPLLQFLNTNFPSLCIDNLQDILQVNALLTHALKQQQQLQQQLQQHQALSAASTPTQPPPVTSLPPVQPKPTPTILAKKPLSSAAATGSGPVPSLPVPVQTVKAKLAAPIPSLKQAAPISTPKPLAAVPSPKPVTPILSPKVKIDSVKKLVLPPAPSRSLVTSSVGVSSVNSADASTNTASPSGMSAGTRTPVFVRIIKKPEAAENSQDSTVTTSAGTNTPTQKPKPRSGPVVVPNYGSTRLSRTPLANPLILQRPKTASELTVQTTLASVPTGPAPASISRRSASKNGTPARASAKVAAESPTCFELLKKTVVSPAETESMEVDVGQPVKRLEFPPHLRDHTYCIYNPEEGDVMKKARMKNIRVVSNIPPARLSYAPQVPESPTTLYKLCKVIPRKSTSRSASTASSRTSTSRSATPKGRGARLVSA